MAAWKADIKYSGTLWSNPKVTKEVKQAMKDTVEGGGPAGQEPIKTRLQRDTPVRTGLMRRSWKVSHGDRSVVITNSANYAGFIEYGTTKIAPRRPLGKNVDWIAQTFRNNLSQRILEKIETTGRGQSQLRTLQRTPARIIGPRQTLPRRL